MAQGHSIDDYLETIYFLAFPIGEYRPDTRGASTLAVRVADMLGVSRASAGEMLKRLEAEGLVERGEHKEAILTAAGRERAEKVVRKHRIIERLLTDFMGYTAAEAPAQATIVRLAEHDGELLHWFYDEGLTPGTKLELKAAQPAAGQFTVRIDGGEKAIGEKAAAGLFVRPAAY